MGIDRTSRFSLCFYVVLLAEEKASLKENMQKHKQELQEEEREKTQVSKGV